MTPPASSRGPIRASAPPSSLLPLTLLISAACGADAPRRGAHTVTDSAGIRIVASARPAWAAEQAWRLAAEPRLRIGRVQGSEDELLHRVTGVVALDDGGVAVANGGDLTVRFYDADGRLVRSVGGRGAGPGEYRDLTSLTRVGDELWAFDHLQGLRVYDLEGELLRSVTPPRDPGVVVLMVRGIFADGSLLMGDWPQAWPATPEARVDSSTLVRAHADGDVDTLAVLPAMRYLPVPGYPFMTGQQFGPMLALVAHPEGFFHAFGAAYEVVERDAEGRVRRIIRRDAEPRPVTEAHQRSYREAMANLGMEGGGEVPPRMQAQRRAIVDAQVYPDHHRPFDRLLAARDGTLWVRRYDPDAPSVYGTVSEGPHRWDVFDAERIWLGTVELPGALVVYDIGRDHVAGVWRDEMDVEYAVLFDLVKPGRER